MWASAWRGWKPKCSLKIFSIQCCPRKMRRDILQYVQHCLCHNQLWLPWRYLRAWRRWGYSSPWCASTYQWSCHYRRGSWHSLDDKNCSRRRTAWADSMEKKQAVWKRFFLPWIDGNTSKQIWGTMTKTLGDQGNSARVLGIKGNWA